MRSTGPPASTPGSSTRSCSSTRSRARSQASAPWMPTCCASRRTTASRDAQIAELRGLTEAEVRTARWNLGVRPVFKTVDTCAGEFPALTPYHYSSYDSETEVVPSDRRKVVILGSGPNRIGQGVEFDYSCVHASFALHDAGFETIMINCNPETVSTDYDTSDRLYFEPLTLEDVLEVIHAESQSGELVGVVVQLGGQTALGLAQGLKDAGIPILGTTPEAIDLAEERGLFSKILDDAGLLAPKNGTATEPRRGHRDRGAHRIPRARAPQPRARRPRHGDRLRHRVARRLLRPRARPGDHRPGLAAAGRPLPRRRDRDRRRRALRRHRALRRRRHGAHRGGRHPLGRLGVHAAARDARARRDQPGARRDARDRQGHRGDGTAQRAVRDRPGRALRARGQSAGEPHGAVRVEGARHPAREGRVADHGRAAASARSSPTACCRRRTARSCRSTRRSR